MEQLAISTRADMPSGVLLSALNIHTTMRCKGLLHTSPHFVITMWLLSPSYFFSYAELIENSNALFVPQLHLDNHVHRVYT